MTKKPTENIAMLAKDINDKIGRWYLREKTKILLSLPIPMKYEVWSELHKYLEELE